MSRRNQRLRKKRKRIVKPKQPSPPRDSEEGWSRAGAHNIAGVSFQVAATARLLIDARFGQLPLTRATPEGFEDIDIEFRDGTRVLVQVKERSPTNHFSRSDLAGAIRKKSTFLTQDVRCHFVLATNATLGGGLSATGWNRTLSQCLNQADADMVAEQLEASFSDPYEILNRTHILHFGWDVVEASRRDLAHALEIPLSVAVLAYARLVEQITEISVQQRSGYPHFRRVDCAFGPGCARKAGPRNRRCR